MLLISLILLAGCKKDNSDVDRILIKGKLASGNKSENYSVTKNVTSDLPDAKKVLVFYGNRYDLAEISNSLFPINTETGKTTALVFPDGSNNYTVNLFA